MQLQPTDFHPWCHELEAFLRENDEGERRVQTPLSREHEILEIRVRAAYRLGLWQLMWETAATLVERDPMDPQWWILWAYAARRIESTEAARLILGKATHVVCPDAMIQFNLACYEVDLGNVEAAREHLKRAFQLGPEWFDRAMEDEDLRALCETATGSQQGLN